MSTITLPSGTRVANTTVMVSVDPDSLTDVLLLVSVTVQEPIGFFVVTSLSQDSAEAPISHGLGGLQAAMNSSITEIRSFDLLIIKICNGVENIR